MKFQTGRVATAAALAALLVSMSLPSSAAVNSADQCGDKSWAGAGAAGCLVALNSIETKPADRTGESQLTLSIVDADSSSAPAGPEPETYVLVLAGLGVVGLIAGRRKIQG